MAAATLTSTSSGYGIFKVFYFSSVSDTNTFAGPVGPKAWWGACADNTGTYVAVLQSAGTYTFHVSGSCALYLFVVV